jgi:hypothetical protein
MKAPANARNATAFLAKTPAIACREEAQSLSVRLPFMPLAKRPQRPICRTNHVRTRGSCQAWGRQPCLFWVLRALRAVAGPPRDSYRQSQGRPCAPAGRCCVDQPRPGSKWPSSTARYHARGIAPFLFFSPGFNLGDAQIAIRLSKKLPLNLKYRAQCCHLKTVWRLPSNDPDHPLSL